MNGLEREQWEREYAAHLDRVSEAQQRLIEALQGYQLWLQRGVDNGWQVPALTKPTPKPDA